MPRKSQEQLDAEFVRIGQSISHLVRVGILRSLVRAGEPMSPNDLSQELGEPLGNTAYHVRRLETLEAVELVSATPRRGALEHYYGLTSTGRQVVKRAGIS